THDGVAMTCLLRPLPGRFRSYASRASRRSAWAPNRPGRGRGWTLPVRLDVSTDPQVGFTLLPRKGRAVHPTSLCHREGRRRSGALAPQVARAEAFPAWPGPPVRKHELPAAIPAGERPLPTGPEMTDWSQVVQQHGPMVWRTAHRLLNNEADAAD